MSPMNLQTIAAVALVALMTWTAATTQSLSIQIAELKVGFSQRLERLEFWAERLATRVNNLETSREEK